MLYDRAGVLDPSAEIWWLAPVFVWGRGPLVSVWSLLASAMCTSGSCMGVLRPTVSRESGIPQNSPCSGLGRTSCIIKAVARGPAGAARTAPLFSFFFFFFFCRFSQAKKNNTKNYWKLKKRLCVRLCSGDKHHLRKSSDRKAH